MPSGGGGDLEDSQTGPEWAEELRYTIRTCDALNGNDSHRLMNEDLVPNGWDCLGRIKRCDVVGGGLPWGGWLWGFKSLPPFPGCSLPLVYGSRWELPLVAPQASPSLCQRHHRFNLWNEPTAQLTSWSCAWCLITAVAKALTQLLCSPSTETNEQALTPAALNDQSLGAYYL